MLSAIGSSSLSYSVANTQSSAALEAQLKQYQNKLADCVSCSSSKTPEGKSNIKEISEKISSLEAQIEKISTVQAKKSEAVLPVNTQNNVNETFSSAAGHIGQNINFFV